MGVAREDIASQARHSRAQHTSVQAQTRDGVLHCTPPRPPSPFPPGHDSPWRMRVFRERGARDGPCASRMSASRVESRAGASFVLRSRPTACLFPHVSAADRPSSAARWPWPPGGEARGEGGREGRRLRAGRPGLAQAAREAKDLAREIAVVPPGHRLFAAPTARRTPRSRRCSYPSTVASGTPRASGAGGEDEAARTRTTRRRKRKGSEGGG